MNFDIIMMVKYPRNEWNVNSEFQADENSRYDVVHNDTNNLEGVEPNWKIPELIGNEVKGQMKLDSNGYRYNIYIFHKITGEGFIKKVYINF